MSFIILWGINHHLYHALNDIGTKRFSDDILIWIHGRYFTLAANNIRCSGFFMKVFKHGYGVISEKCDEWIMENRWSKSKKMLKKMLRWENFLTSFHQQCNYLSSLNTISFLVPFKFFPPNSEVIRSRPIR